MKYIVSGLLFLVLSAVLLTVYFVFGKDSKTENKLSLTSEDIVMTVGDKIEDFYSISEENATIVITIADEAIVNIANDKLIALKAGTTEVTITATYKNKNYSTSFSVQVVKPTYTYSVDIMHGATFSDGTIYQTSQNVQFAIAIKDNHNKNVSYGRIELSKTNPGAIFEKQVSNFLLVNNQNCEITISFLDLDYEITLAVVAAA
jgi:hypothetical protein